MFEYETVEEALHALSEINGAREIDIQDIETGKIRQATVEDIQSFNMKIFYQLVDLLNINLSEVEAWTEDSDDGWNLN